MKYKRATLTRLALLIIGVIGGVTGFIFVLSNGAINPIPGFRYDNNLSGIVFGTLGILIAVAEMGQLYNDYKNAKS
jgi:hypothetical protein